MSKMQIGFNPLCHIESGPNRWNGTLNILKQAGTWGFVSKQPYGAADMDFDENGYPRQIPAKLRMRFGWWPAYVAGVYRCSGAFKFHIGAGRGTIKLQHSGGGGTIIAAQEVDASSGPVVFDFDYVPTGRGLLIEISATDATNHLRDFAVVHSDGYEDWLSGAIFDPKYIEMIAKTQIVRAMKMCAPNIKLTDNDGFWCEQDRVTWSWGYSKTWNDGAVLDDSRGWPLEAMVDLVNRATAYRKDVLGLEGAVGLWLTPQVNASDDFIRATAQYLRDTLHPDIVVRIENGNECWNGTFQSYPWLDAQAEARWGTDANEQDMHGLLTVRNGRIFKEVLGNDRVITTLGGWWVDAKNNNPKTRQSLTAPRWEEVDPETFQLPHREIDEVASSFYPLGSTKTQDTDMITYFIELDKAGGDGTGLMWRTIMEHWDPKIDNAYVVNTDETLLHIPSLNQNDCLNLWPAFVEGDMKKYIQLAHSNTNNASIMLGADVDNYVRFVADGVGGTNIEIRTDPDMVDDWFVIANCAVEITDTVQNLVLSGQIIARGFYNGFYMRISALDALVGHCVDYGAQLVIYEGGPAPGTGVGKFTDPDLWQDHIAWWKDRCESHEMGQFTQTCLQVVQSLGVRTMCIFGDIQESWDSNQFGTGQYGAVWINGQQGDATQNTPVWDAIEAW